MIAQSDLFLEFCSLPSLCFKSFLLDPVVEMQKFLQGEYSRFVNEIISKNNKRNEQIHCFFSESYDYQNYCMEEEELKEYNFTQLEHINDYKCFLESKQNKRYSMNEVVKLWAEQHSADFRRKWHLKKMLEI